MVKSKKLNENSLTIELIIQQSVRLQYHFLHSLLSFQQWPLGVSVVIYKSHTIHTHAHTHTHTGRELRCVSQGCYQGAKKALSSSLSELQHRWHIEMIVWLGPLHVTHCYPSIKTDEWSHLLPCFTPGTTETDTFSLPFRHTHTRTVGLNLVLLLTDLIKPKSPSVSPLPDFLPFLFFYLISLPFSLFSLQVCRGFARTLKWWLVSSQTDSGESAGPSWLRPSWRYICFCSSHSPSLTHTLSQTHTDMCGLKCFHLRCRLSSSLICSWKGTGEKLLLLRWNRKLFLPSNSCHVTQSQVVCVFGNGKWKIVWRQFSCCRHTFISTAHFL